MHDAGGVDGPRVDEPWVAGAEALEEALAVAEEDRHEADLHLVDEIRGEVLPCRARSAGERDHLPGCSLARLLQRRLDSVRDERERRAALALEWLARVVREHEDGVVERRIVAPPAGPGILRPRPGLAAEHVAAHDRGARRRAPVLDDLLALVPLAPLGAVCGPPRLELEGPLVQPHAADAQRVLDALGR